MDHCITNFVQIRDLKKFEEILDMCESDDGDWPELISTEDLHQYRNHAPIKYGFVSRGINGFRVPEHAHKCKREKCFGCKKLEKCNDNKTVIALNKISDLINRPVSIKINPMTQNGILVEYEFRGNKNEYCEITSEVLDPTRPDSTRLYFMCRSIAEPKLTLKTDETKPIKKLV